MFAVIMSTTALTLLVLLCCLWKESSPIRCPVGR